MSTPRERHAALALVAVAVLIGIAHAGHGPAFGADDHGQYLMHAKALVEGRPYEDIGFIHTPYSTMVGPIAEPPGLPVLIAGVFKVAGLQVNMVRVILYAGFALFGYLTWGYMRGMASATTAALVTAWSLVAIARFHALDTVLADLPFCAALWLCFQVADSGRARGRRLALLALAGAVAFSFRLAALPLLPAAATALVVRDREDRAGFFTLGVVWTAAAAAVMLLLPSADVLGSETLRTPAVLWQDILRNAAAVVEGVRGWIMVSLPTRPLTLALVGTVVAVTMLGTFVSVRREPRRFVWIAAAWYLVMLAMLPTRAQRYLWPLYPLLSFGFLEGARWLAGRVRLDGTRVALPGGVFAAILVCVGAAQDVATAAPPTYRSIADVQTMRGALAREAGGARRLRVVSFAPRVMAWEDGYTTMAMFDAPADEMLRVLERSQITHVVVGDAGTFAIGAAGIERVVRERPHAFHEVFRNASFAVYAFHPPA